uniref:Putative fungal zinc cluster transcription factor n=2 Tax=Kalmanozyma brasiliensis (strain GHG001) TaxID=1365824 RepID=V5EXE8_KALBG
MSEGKESQLRQRPGDVYAPYPYRKGYASLMRYMTEQDWSEQSIRSVEAALSKIRQLWFSLEDNIQPSSMIQLQAEWAGNVRYYSESVIPFTPVPMVVCRKAGEVYASNQLAQELCGRSREQMTGGKISVYELMTEASASMFFRLYELAVGGTQAEDGTYIPSVGKTAPLYWNAEIVQLSADGSRTVIPARGIFEMKIAPCGLPSLVVCCFVRLS